ncbi:MAG: restriction endonuclease subunit S [Ruminococcaceae bacterium]|nr:restriction endonuclease subunit S [Oscillospiraceae bacterium]
MLNLNDREWKVFKISSLFKIVSGRDTILDNNTGNMPYVNSSGVNNGITQFVNEFRVIVENCITIARTGTVGATFYQKGKVAISGNIRALIPVGFVLNQDIALFLIQTIKNTTSGRFSYGKILGTERITNLKILLPITDDGQPDYAFMEQYIREREDKLKQKYRDFVNAQLETPPIPLAEKTWGVFYLKDLFDIIQRGKRLVREHQQAGTMPYVSSTAMNNGIDGFISTERTTREFSNCLTIANSGSVGSSFYQPSKFIASDHITHLKNDSYTMYVYLFIATMTKRMSEKYNFNREINDYRISKEKILLPTTDEGSPDYEYMEQYIKAVMFGKYKKYLEYQKCPLL